MADFRDDKELQGGLLCPKIQISHSVQFFLDKAPPTDVRIDEMIPWAKKNI